MLFCVLRVNLVVLRQSGPLSPRDLLSDRNFIKNFDFVVHLARNSWRHRSAARIEVVDGFLVNLPEVLGVRYLRQVHEFVLRVTLIPGPSKSVLVCLSRLHHFLQSPVLLAQLINRCVFRQQSVLEISDESLLHFFELCNSTLVGFALSQHLICTLDMSFGDGDIVLITVELHLALGFFAYVVII